MSLTDIKNRNQGFTIVELLIVVVVIAILAAITIVSYNGITNNAHSSAADAAASTLQKKVELYNSDKGAYPTSLADLEAGTGSDSWAVTEDSVTIVGTAAGVTKSDEKALFVQSCGTDAGVVITFNAWSSPLKTVTAGDCSGAKTTWTE